jgi:hypothetical protein
MVALPLAPNAMKIRIVGVTQSRPFVHIMHLQYSGGVPVVADCNAIANAVRAAYNTNFAPMLNTATTAQLFEVTDLASSVGATGSNNTAVTGSGGVVTTLSVSLAAVVSWKSALHFRGGHARTYFPFRLASDVLSGNQLLGTYATGLQAAATAFLAALTNQTTGTITYTLAMLSYHSHNTPRPVPLSFAITAAQVHSRIDTQRRRLGKEF